MPNEAMITAKNVDLSNCDREQIQFAAATLAHGLLLVLSEPELTVTQAGENAPDTVGIPLNELLGLPLDTWLAPAIVDALRERIRQIPGDGPPVHVGSFPIHGKQLDLFVHRCANSLIVEFEERGENTVRLDGDIYSRVHDGMFKLQAAPDLEDFLDRAVSQIRNLTGFDRVMAYQFLADGSGAVRAESVAPGFEPFLGLHYPASDIPLPARRLFKMTWVRHQPDIDYVPVRVIPELNPVTRQPLDLSYALLRSVSVMYSQYLKNMGTRSSMVLTLMKNGELWGLIACHHHSGPRHVPVEIRAACEFGAHLVSLLLAAKEDQEDSAYQLKLQASHVHLVSALETASNIATVLVDRRPGLMEFVNAGGAALVLHNRPILLGNAPQPEQVQALVKWLSDSGGHTVFSTDCLSSLYPDAAEYADSASGLLAIRLTNSTEDYVLWFRPEFQRTVDWAGDPQKPVDISDDGQRLLPRTSFAIWKETVRRKSRPWKTVEIQAARSLREALLEIAARRADQLQVLYDTLQRTHAELDTFAYIASHDLKEPLRGIHNYSQFILEDVGETLPQDAADKLRTVVRLTRRMDELLDSLLHYARLGRQGMDVAPCDVNQVVAEVLDTLAARIEETGTEVRVAGTLPCLTADRGRLSEVFMNLISNALKYNDKPVRWVEIGAETDVGEPTFFVRDNGIGIPPEHQETIFAIFRRLHGPDRFGGGTGAGLTIVRKILERHDGRVWVDSTPGAGSTFYFTIGTR